MTNPNPPQTGLSFFDPKTGVTYVALGALGTLVATAISSNTSWNSLLIAAGVGVALGVVYMLINNFTPGDPLRVPQQIGFGLLNCIVLIFVIFGGMAAIDKTQGNNSTTQIESDTVGVPPPPPPGSAR